MIAPLPDRDELERRLEEARAGRALLTRLIDWLEQGLALHEGDSASGGVANGEASKPAAALPAGPRKEGQRDRDAKVNSFVLNAAGPVSSGDVVAALALTVSEARGALQRLVQAGRLTQTGDGRWRRYAPAGAVPHTEHRARSEAGIERTARSEDAAISRLALRERVYRAVCANQGDLDDARLAQHPTLAADSAADVFNAVNELVAQGKLARDPSGTYRRAK